MRECKNYGKAGNAGYWVSNRFKELAQRVLRGAIVLGAEEDGFALEHFDGQEERDGGVNASRREDDGDKVPMISAGDELLAEKTDVEDGDEGELRSELDAGQHRSDGRNDDDESHGGDVGLRFFVGLGKESDGHQGGGKEHRNGQGHEENRKNRLEAGVKNEVGGVGLRGSRF